VKLYLELREDHLLPIDEEYCRKMFFRELQLGAFFRVWSGASGELRAWILAKPMILITHPKPVFKQIFYGSNLSGVTAVRALSELHGEMEEEGRRLKIQFLVSEGSPFDTTDVLSRTLERRGWKRVGNTAVKQLF
jgi:hypothetical protein